MRIVGLDVCKDRVVAFLLDTDDPPIEPRQLYISAPFPVFYADAGGIRGLMELGPDVAVLEPTGVNYSRIWVTKMTEQGIPVALVGHKQLRTYRESMGLPDKDDQADALALAHYYRDNQHYPSRFVRARDPVVAKMRELVLRLHHQARVQSPLVNRLRQDLAWQFPEAAGKQINARLFWRWLAGVGKSSRYDELYRHTVGLKLTDHTRSQARLLVEVLQIESKIELELRALLNDPRFGPYRTVMSRYGLGDRVSALIISQVYPIQNYLTDGKATKIKTRSKTDHTKETTKHLSERKLLKALGLAPQRESSGDSSKTRKSGSKLCRSALWQWVMTRIEVKRNRPHTLPQTQWLVNPQTRELRSGTLADYFDYQKAHAPVRLARMRTAARAVRLLLHDLIDEVQQHDSQLDL